MALSKDLKRAGKKFRSIFFTALLNGKEISSTRLSDNSSTILIKDLSAHDAFHYQRNEWW